MAVDFKAEFEALQTEFRTLRDDAKLKAALAKMDIKTQWEELSPKLERAVSSTEIVTQELVGDLKRRFTELKARITAD